uniref:Uncharacterized protein n=1 Tax=Prymnesium polylepis TaxID=72548 RepID=A0A6T7Z4E4_9EUKA|mmetsp:Transcript_24711/g.61391  ORF Transcript_24711/g.61391 Transcript_24711/m.61391 type:complete len:158 (+) Transcript_24711:101-574(+)
MRGSSTGGGSSSSSSYTPSKSSAAAASRTSLCRCAMSPLPPTASALPPEPLPAAPSVTCCCAARGAAPPLPPGLPRVELVSGALLRMDARHDARQRLRGGDVGEAERLLEQDARLAEQRDHARGGLRRRRRVRRQRADGRAERRSLTASPICAGAPI